MGFTWESLDTVKASSVVEMKDAVNTLTDLKTAPRFNWQQPTPVAGDMITAGRYQELQAAADYADNRNVCLSDKAAYYTTYNITENSIDDAANDVNQDVTNNVTIYTAHDIGYDATKYAQVDDDQNVTYDATKDIGYDATKYDAVDNDQNVTYNAAKDIGYDSSLDVNYKSALYTTYKGDNRVGVDSTQYYTNKSAQDSAINGTNRAGFSSSCFTGESLTMNYNGHLVRLDSVRSGDALIGAYGQINEVLGVEKVPVGSRTLLSLGGTDALFTGEHCFLLPDGRWGSFNKEAMDRELAADHITFVEVDGVMHKIVGDMTEYDDESVTQIDSGEEGMFTNGEVCILNVLPTEENAEFVYTFFMGGNRTFNIEGVVVSGLAFTGENPRLEKV